MTRAEFITKFPHATEQVIRLNCSDYLKGGGANALAGHKRLIQTNSVKRGIPSNPAPRAHRVPRTRNANTWTEAEMWSRIRSCLRRMSIYWKPARAALLASRVPFNGPRGQKWAFLCADCQRLFKRKDVQIDHVIPCGALTSYDHVGPFLARLLPEDPSAFRIVCKKCHRTKTNAELTKRRATSSSPSSTRR